MSKPQVGVSILTNGNRRPWLEKCVEVFLDNCHYRPLVIGIYNNGSTDDTEDWITKLPDAYGVEWRAVHSGNDMGCAYGTNASIEMVNDCEFQIHIESDFIHQPEHMTGADKFWLHRAVEYMQKSKCDYLYLRRMENEHDIFMHWWSQWMPLLEGDGEFMRCNGFWWSNNPTLFRTKALVDAGTLPLNISIDGQKGEPGWSQPELQAKKPPNAHIHRWGMFMHEMMEPMYNSPMGCGRFPRVGTSSCKYGFYKDGKDRFCQSCDLAKGYSEMPEHEQRFRNGETVSRGDIVLGTIVVNEETLRKHLQPCLTDELSQSIVLSAEPEMPISRAYNRMMDSINERFLILCHPDVEFSEDVYNQIRRELSKPEVGVVGLVGVNDDGKQVWAQNLREPRKVSSLDGCFIAIDTTKGLRFDEQTFDGLHCYADDLCYQARDQGLKVKVVPAKHFIHASETLKKEGRGWGDYWKYRNKLEQKWWHKMKVVTT